MTNETGRTTQACHEAFQAIFNHAPACSGPCEFESCTSTGSYFVPEGCDGWGTLVRYKPYDECDIERLCDTGSWAKYFVRWYGFPGELLWSAEGNWNVFCGADTDSDGLPDNADNCPDVNNPTQDDTDDNLVGDACDPCPYDSSNDIDADGICGDVDNCAYISNSDQSDSYPPQGNGIGDACECEGDFQCDGDVDGSDASTFKGYFGRSADLRPCVAGDTCSGDFTCDGDVDGTDVSLFKSDFGRSSMQNPCPVCVVGEWCNY
jgi:hypothetical protein